MTTQGESGHGDVVPALVPALHQPTWLRIREIKQHNNRRVVACLSATAAVIALYDVGRVLLG